MSGCKKIRLVCLGNKEDLEIMFSGVTCTNASAMAPGTNEGLDGANSDNDDVEEVTHFADYDKQVRKGSSAHKSPIKKTKKNFRDMQFKRLVDCFVEKRVQASISQHLRIMM
jgi:hypothetical protein